MNKATLIIGGTTASGKTALAISLAKELQRRRNTSAEIVNADSVQMYDELKVLTAYPSVHELRQVRHNLFGILNPYGSSSISSWLNLAQKEIERIHSDGQIAIVCGGTGLYIRVLLNGIADIPTIPERVRKEVQKCFQELGRNKFFEKLSEIDPVSAKKLHPNDTQRILRAYEVAVYTGKSLSEWWKVGNRVNPTKIPTIILHPEKEKVRERAAIRVRRMIEQGAIEEVREFGRRYPNYDGPLQEVIGYREICEFLQCSKGEIGFEKDRLIEKMRVRTNQYIKRQSTWFRNQLKGAKFIGEFGDKPHVVEEVLRYIDQ